MSTPAGWTPIPNPDGTVDVWVAQRHVADGLPLAGHYDFLHRKVGADRTATPDLTSMTATLWLEDGGRSPFWCYGGFSQGIWTITGDPREAGGFTVSPSILCSEAHGGCGRHGFITAGRWQDCS